MLIKRREFVTVAAMGGLATVFGTRQADAQLLALGWFLITFAEPYIKAAITEYATNAGKDLGRSVYTATSGSSASGAIHGPGRAIVTVSMQKQSSGSVTIHATMPDGNGQRAITHDGTSPDYQHAMTRGHVVQIIGKAHNWMRTHNR